MQLRKYDTYKTQLLNLLSQAKTNFVASNDQNGLEHIREIENIINNKKLKVSNQWDLLQLKINNMPGYFSFWNSCRKFTLDLKTLLKSYTKIILIEDELDYLQSQVTSLQEENSVLKDQVLSLKNNSSKENSRLKKENVELRNKYDELNDNYNILIKLHEGLVSENKELKKEIQALQLHAAQQEEKCANLQAQAIEQGKVYEAKITEQNEKINKIKIETDKKLEMFYDWMNRQNNLKFTNCADSQLDDTSNQPGYTVGNNRQSLWTHSEYANLSTDKTQYEDGKPRDLSSVYLTRLLK